MVRREQYNVKRQISMTTRKELIEALRARYRSAAFGDRIRILDEFVALTGYHRKHAIRVLRQEFSNAKATRARNRLYDEAVRQALTLLWEAAAFARCEERRPTASSAHMPRLCTSKATMSSSPLSQTSRAIRLSPASAESNSSAQKGPE